MPIRDVEAMNASLDNDYGATHGPNAPAGYDLALFSGDPMIPAIEGGGVEADPTGYPGYARVPVAHSAFPAAADGMKAVSVLGPTPTGEWADEITHWGLFWTGTNILADNGPFTEALDITSAGAPPAINFAVYYDDSVTQEE